jgi:polyisoprenoid-binding protein YceI
MDKKTYDALKSEEHPEIKFDLSNGKVREVNGNSFIVEASGSLEIAGVTRDIEFEAEGEKMSPNQYKFTGNHKINMKDYDMEPPSAMFGQIVTGEEVTINFELVLDGE